MAFSIPKATLKILNQTGFSSELISHGKRLIRKDGRFNIHRKGSKSFDIYHFIFEISWFRFLSNLFIIFILTNLIFAGLFYYVGVEQLVGIPLGQSFSQTISECFFFSVQTFTTVGYGHVFPTGNSANWLASLLSFIGFFSFSVFTGLSLARFLKPQSKIRFSSIALINQQDKVPALQFRIVNARPAKLFSVEATVVMTCLVKQSNGAYTRRFSSLKLEYEKVIMLPIDWTITHFIDEASPLKGLSPEMLKEIEAEFLVSIKAYDDAYNQDIHANHSYLYDEIEWNAHFQLMYKSKDHHTVLDLNKLSTFEKTIEKVVS